MSWLKHVSSRSAVRCQAPPHQLLHILSIFPSIRSSSQKSPHAPLSAVSAGRSVITKCCITGALQSSLVGIFSVRHRFSPKAHDKFVLQVQQNVLNLSVFPSFARHISQLLRFLKTHPCCFFLIVCLRWRHLTTVGSRSQVLDETSEFIKANVIASAYGPCICVNVHHPLSFFWVGGSRLILEVSAMQPSNSNHYRRPIWASSVIIAPGDLWRLISHKCVFHRLFLLHLCYRLFYPSLVRSEG